MLTFTTFQVYDDVDSFIDTMYVYLFT